jgi:hypothetical protein
MAFSQELKIEAFRNGFRCAELPITYRPRGGQTKLRTVRDGALNISHLLAHRTRVPQKVPSTHMLHLGQGRLGLPHPTLVPALAVADEPVPALTVADELIPVLAAAEESESVA